MTALRKLSAVICAEWLAQDLLRERRYASGRRKTLCPGNRVAWLERGIARHKPQLDPGVFFFEYDSRLPLQFISVA